MNYCKEKENRLTTFLRNNSSKSKRPTKDNLEELLCPPKKPNSPQAWIAP
jgi:hypothetical protein